MEYMLIEQKKNMLKDIKHSIPNSFIDDFDIEYAHNSTAIEGNTLTLDETKTILQDELSVGGKSIREIFEVYNHYNAFNYVKCCVSNGELLSESIVKDIHALLMENIMTGGVYRNDYVDISGAKHKPSAPSEMYLQIKDFYYNLKNTRIENVIELAAWTHAEFVKIHPFEDGNGRTSRLLMNYQLIFNGFLPVSIVKENKIEYFDALEAYATEGDIQPFAEMIAKLEEERLDEYLSIKNENIIKDGMK